MQDTTSRSHTGPWAIHTKSRGFSWMPGLPEGRKRKQKEGLLPILGERLPPQILEQTHDRDVFLSLKRRYLQPPNSHSKLVPKHLERLDEKAGRIESMHEGSMRSSEFFQKPANIISPELVRDHISSDQGILPPYTPSDARLSSAPNKLSLKNSQQRIEDTTNYAHSVSNSKSFNTHDP